MKPFSVPTGIFTLLISILFLNDQFSPSLKTELNLYVFLLFNPIIGDKLSSELKFSSFPSFL